MHLSSMGSRFEARSDQFPVAKHLNLRGIGIEPLIGLEQPKL